MINTLKNIFRGIKGVLLYHEDENSHQTLWLSYFLQSFLIMISFVYHDVWWRQHYSWSSWIELILFLLAQVLVHKFLLVAGLLGWIFLKVYVGYLLQGKDYPFDYTKGDLSWQHYLLGIGTIILSYWWFCSNYYSWEPIVFLIAAQIVAAILRFIDSKI